ncbi:MAG: cysteine desulfurase [Clostridia bacterium]|nr:cysteine desulfurase [Clostridia bacterium]
MIYFDNAATTVPSKSAIDKAIEFNNDKFYNPSTLYNGGLNCAKEIKCAKDSILRCLGAISNDYEVIFTSCGSESDNQAIFCTVKRGIFVTDKGEHSAVHKSFLELKNRGLSVEFIDLNKDGSVNTERLYDFIEKNSGVSFVSIMHVNNETGAINDVNTIADRIKKINPSIIFHVDGVQAYAKLPYRLSNKIDLYSISAHKINGIKGVGALIKRKKLNVSPLIFGGGQENGLRSGTENVFGIKVFQYATEERALSLKENYKKVQEIKEFIAENLDKDVFTVLSSIDSSISSPYILSVSAKGLRGEVLMHLLEMENILVGNGSACSSKNRFSRVLTACGYDEKILDGVLRISFSPNSTMQEAEIAVKIINEKAKKLKETMR